MEIKEITINSNQDNLPISIAMIIPNTEIKGIFQISHGMAEHKERYYDFMKYLASNGYITIINDHRGHGKSIKNKEWIKSQEFLKKLGYENIEGKLYPNLRHEILNEEKNIKIYEDILKFII